MSLRARLLLAVGAVALVALIAADVATYYALRSSLVAHVDQTLDITDRAVRGAILGPGALLPASTTTSEQPQLPDSLTKLAPGTFVQVRSAGGIAVAGQVQAAAVAGGRTYTPKLPKTIAGLTAGTPAGGYGQIAPPSPGTETTGTAGGAGGTGGTGVGTGGGGGPPQASSPAVYFTTAAQQSGGPLFRVRASLLPGGQQLIVAAPLTETYGTLHRLLAAEAMVTAAALLAAVLLGWWLVRVGLRPLADVERTAEAIAAGELDQRVPGENPRTEVGRLATVLNTMLGRIQTAFAQRDATEAELRASEDRLRRFVADASHELRTPLAAVSAYAELLDGGAVRDEQDLHRVMTGIREETSRMGTLVEDLLLLARLDEGRPLACEPTELVSLVAETAQTARTLGPDWPVVLEADTPVEVCGDRERLRQAVANLLGNVRAHTPPGTTTTVRLRAEDDEAVIEVADDGPGLTAEQAARVFERFYRADASRSRAHGGAGLGLSIVAAIVAAQGGSVSAAPAAGGGAVFTIRLPLAAETSPA